MGLTRRETIRSKVSQIFFGIRNAALEEKRSCRKAA